MKNRRLNDILILAALLVILFFILTYISPALIHTQANTGMMYLAAALFTAVTFGMIPILRMYARNNTL